jgi:hypothetical protein
MIYSEVVQVRLVILPISGGRLLIVPSKRLVIYDRIPITALVKQREADEEKEGKGNVG